MLDYEELFELASSKRTGRGSESEGHRDGILTKLRKKVRTSDSEAVQMNL